MPVRWPTVGVMVMMTAVMAPAAYVLHDLQFSWRHPIISRPPAYRRLRQYQFACSINSPGGWRVGEPIVVARGRRRAGIYGGSSYQ